MHSHEGPKRSRGAAIDRNSLFDRPVLRARLSRYGRQGSKGARNFAAPTTSIIDPEMNKNMSIANYCKLLSLNNTWDTTNIGDDGIKIEKDMRNKRGCVALSGSRPGLRGYPEVVRSVSPS